MEARNRRRLVLALALLVVALVVVLARNRDFWFGSDESADSEANAPVAAQTTIAKNTPPATPATPAATNGGTAADSATTPNPTPASNPAPAASSAPAPTPAPVAKKKVEPKKKEEKSEIVAKAAAAPVPAATPAATPATTAEPAPTVSASTRKQLPPMEVEVVAGESHHSLRADSNDVLVEIPTHTSASKTFQWNPVTNAAELTRMPSDLPERVQQAEQGSYPSLAKQMKVQGSVILRAYVGADGGIKDLRVVSGNPILVSAAVEAARQWRFTPYLQNGQAVETQAKIQVNFMIKVL
jgi:protein TonB